MLVLVLLVSVLVTDTPEENRFISAKELHYITHCTELHRLQKEIPENTPGVRLRMRDTHIIISILTHACSFASVVNNYILNDRFASSQDRNADMDFF